MHKLMYVYVKPLELKLKVYTSITSWFVQFKSVLFVYRGRIANTVSVYKNWLYVPCLEVVHSALQRALCTDKLFCWFSSTASLSICMSIYVCIVYTDHSRICNTAHREKPSKEVHNYITVQLQFHTLMLYDVLLCKSLCKLERPKKI